MCEGEDKGEGARSWEARTLVAGLLALGACRNAQPLKLFLAEEDPHRPAAGIVQHDPFADMFGFVAEADDDCDRDHDLVEAYLRTAFASPNERTACCARARDAIRARQ